MASLDRVVRVLTDTAALVLPVRCAGCDRPGEGWCAACRAAARRAPPVSASADPPRWSATVLEGPVRRAVTAHKDGGRRDLRGVLAPLLGVALARALLEDPVLRAHRAGGRPVAVVPVPTAPAARRRRGDDPVAALAAAVVEVAGAGLRLVPVLAHRRRVGDQATLGRSARRANLAGAMAVRDTSAGAVAGLACVVVDDVVTTGATLAEAARVLRLAGAAHVAGATVAATP